MVRDCPGNTQHHTLMLVGRSPSKETRSKETRSKETRSLEIRLIALLVVSMAAAMLAPEAIAQQRPHHYLLRADMPAGTVGRAQLMRGGPLPGHFQAVEVLAPEGTRIAMATDGVFEQTQPAPLKAGMLVGHVYRLKVTNIPFQEGQEVFPTIEVINRLYPPAGSQVKFPIPIELTREELEMALRGQFVIRVIYLENPRTALPRREDPAHQRYFEVGPSQDPLEVADGLGRPMAILRIGSRVPELNQISGRFLFQSPPWVRFPEVIRDAPTEAPAATQPEDATAARIGWPIVPPVTAHRPPTGAGVNR